MHGVASSFTDSFTGNNTGQTIAIAQPLDPVFPARQHVVSVCTIVGTVTGATRSYDVQAKDGIFSDSGQPPISIAGTTGTVFRYDGIASSQTVKAVRTRVSNWSGGTSASIVTTLVSLV